MVTEEEPPYNEFTHKLCARWEEIACRAQSDKTRVCLLRTGVVLAPDGGILGKMLPPFRLGLGGPIGSGRQYLAWIHIDDMVNGILWLLDNELRGPFNMVSPYPYAMNNLPMRSVMRCIARHFARPCDRHSTVNGRIFSTSIRWTTSIA